MGITTWLDRITDESNLWLSAVKAEEAKDFSSAAIQYLADAEERLKRGSQVRAALSCYCAADCLARMGAMPEARRLFVEAGKLYATIADHGVSASIREGLWALQRAYGCYILAGEVKESEAAFESFRLLARRANPFTQGSDWLEMPKVPSRHREGDGKRAGLKPEAKRALENFLVLKREEDNRAQSTASMVARRTGGMIDDQESFVSQLG